MSYTNSIIKSGGAFLYPPLAVYYIDPDNTFQLIGSINVVFYNLEFRNIFWHVPYFSVD